jgi:hypothetical protein
VRIASCCRAAVTHREQQADACAIVVQELRAVATARDIV